MNVRCEHVWVRRSVRGHDEVHCARCYRCLGVDVMLRAYVQVHGGTIQGERTAPARKATP